MAAMINVVKPPVEAPAAGQQQPSAAAAAGAAAAALLQKQLAADGAVISAETSLASGWSEHQTGDGRKFYYHDDTQITSWEKPEVLMTPEERANDTKWREYKIWDGRSFYHNRETRVSCWSMPPELRRIRGESSGVDDRPIPATNAELRRGFWELLREKGVDETWTWQGVSEAMRDEPQALGLSEPMRKQCFAELVGYHLKQKDIETRKAEREGASAFERLIEERFSSAADLGVTFDEAAKQLSGEPAWNRIKSDVRRDEVFQVVMERLEEKHKKARLESRTANVVRLQRLMASDPELRRARLRWKDVVHVLGRKDELHHEEVPLEALRVWASLRELRQASEFEAEARTKSTTAEAQKSFREERKRRDAFVQLLKELAIQCKVSAESQWEEVAAAAEGDPRLVGVQENNGAPPMELFDEFAEALRQDGPRVVLGVMPGSQEVAVATAKAAAEVAEAPRKRARTGFSPSEVAAVPEDADDTNALDALIAGGGLEKKDDGGPPAAAAGLAAEEEEEDPLMEAAVAAAAEKAAAAAAAGATATAPVAPAPAAPAPAAAPVVAVAPAVALTATELSAKKVDDLRAMCRERGLPVSGRKQELVDRLAAA